METVRITNDDLKTIGGKLDSIQLRIETSASNIASCLSSINEAWKSPGSQMYVDRLMSEYVEDVKKIAKSVGEYAEFLKHVYATYEEVEDEYKGQIDGIGV